MNRGAFDYLILFLFAATCVGLVVQGLHDAILRFVP